MSIFEKIKSAGLKGRGGAGFPTDLKWQAVADAVVKHPEHRAFVVCNAAEGEPGVFKDGYILEHFPEIMIDGIRLAMDTFKAEQGFIYLRREYFKKYQESLKKIIDNQDLYITLFAETAGYLCGEETTLLESLEGHVEEPRIRPPFPTVNGYHGYPTLINNAETFYCLGRIGAGNFQKTRFYSISGAVANPGVFELSQDLTVKQVLTETKNLPAFKYFVQVGGGASGNILTAEETDKENSGTIIVYDLARTKPLKLMKQWLDFFYAENCGKCVPCREGVLRLREILNDSKADLKDMEPILEVLRDTSFCPLGRSVYSPTNGLLTKVVGRE